MKSFTIIALFGISLVAGSAVAADKSNGCGMGWYFSSNKTILASSIRQSTNSLSSNSVSMTSGTSGCSEHDLVKNEKRSIHFLEANFDHLRMDAAKGQGEFLAAFSETLNCDWQSLGRLGDTAQKNYGYIFSNSQNDSVGTLQRFRNIIFADKQLKNSCS